MTADKDLVLTTVRDHLIAWAESAHAEYVNTEKSEMRHLEENYRDLAAKIDTVLAPDEPHSQHVWTKDAWDQASGSKFIDAMYSGEAIEIDQEMYDYWLGVLPPVWNGGNLSMPLGKQQLVDFGFAEGYEYIVGFWKDGDRFYCQQSIVINDA